MSILARVKVSFALSILVLVQGVVSQGVKPEDTDLFGRVKVSLALIILVLV